MFSYKCRRCNEEIDIFENHICETPFVFWKTTIKGSKPGYISMMRLINKKMKGGK